MHPSAPDTWRLPLRSSLATEHANPLLRYYRMTAGLNDAELAELKRLLHFVRRHNAQTELCTQDETQPPRILLTGWAAQQHVLRNGRRQIIRFLLPGDIIGSLKWPLQPAMSAVVALTSGTLADARPLLQAAIEPTQDNKGWASLIRAAAQAEETSLRNHIVRLGGRTAYERLIHLILELNSRLVAVGAADTDGFVLPLTQEVIADALGMSFVHANRTLQQIRRDGLFTIRSGKVTIHDLEKMQEIAEWNEA